MSYRDDHRYLAAQQRYVAENRDVESPDDAFARRAVAAYQMYLIQIGCDLPEDISEAQALVAYGFTVAKRNEVDPDAA